MDSASEKPTSAAVLEEPSVDAAKGANAATEHIESLSHDTRAALDKAVSRKFDRRVLPFCILMHLCSMIDRANMGNAKVLGLKEDLHLTGNRFNIAMSLFYITYILLEIPANAVIKRIGPKIWLSFLTTSFGIVTMCQAFAISFHGIIAVRIMLGLCDAGVLPGIMFTLASFYRRHELTTRMGYLSAVVSLSGAFGGLLATGFSRIPSGILHTWRHVLFFEGLITILIGFSVVLLPNSPATSSFLTEEERIYACSRLIDEAKALPDEKMNKVTFKRAIMHVPTQLVAVALICSLCCMGSLHIFTPTLLQSMGYSGQQAQLMSVPPYVLGAIVCITTATLSDRLRKRGIFFICLLAPCIFIGFTLNHFVSSVAVRYFGLFLAVSGGFSSSPLLLSWSVDNNSGPAVKAIASAYVIGLGGFGQLLSTWTYIATEAPKYPTGHSINMACACVLFLAVGCHSLWAMRENKKRSVGLRDSRLAREHEGLGHDHPAFKFTP
ncbi:MFS domain-containing protein [Fusarium falciforme]|uniref:MFS domain-containing protein n=1 Tax=Fusarium falciforme TaxID=195108 RepID=UPI0023018DDD|nr:MFS domain-containing protein [Fusarium falciforme]WAO92426.1 MFS domain-containing protein [Fusarium falciforme]